MPQDIIHYSIIEIFYQIGLKNGYYSIKEFALINLIKENTDERIDLVWINPQSKEVEYAFEFDTSKQNCQKSWWKLSKIDSSIKKYCFFAEKSMNFEKVDAIFFSDESYTTFLSGLLVEGVKINLHGTPINEFYNE